MKIYKFEENIKAEIVAASTCTAEVSISKLELSTIMEAAVKGSKISDENKKYMARWMDADLMMVPGVLVSSNWNRNNDVFPPDELKKAYYTARYKPANLNHMGREGAGGNTICGVITDSYLCDDEMKPIWNNPEDEPYTGQLNIAVMINLWEKLWPTPCANLKASIDDGTMFLSMECFLDSFSYALRAVEGSSSEIMILPRNDITSWMTASMTQFKGPGKIAIDGKQYYIGRACEDITFAGVAFTPKPANPDSIIPDYVSKNSMMKIVKASFDDLIRASVLNKNSTKGNVQLWRLPN